jgi:hypothetical protein
MKFLLESFKEFLKEEDIENYSDGSTVTLYHYAPVDADSLIVDPSRFGGSAFSRKEKETSTVPRTFFYLNLDQREPFVAQNRILYKTEVPITSLYNLKRDPENIIQQVRHPTYGLRKGIEFDDLLNTIKEEYPGVFYSMPNMDIVNWFEPLTVTKVPEEERKELERANYNI